MSSEHTTGRQAFIALGSNLGDREKYLQQALSLLAGYPTVRIDQCSSVYETDPVGYTDQALFLNMVVQVTTDLAPVLLMQILLNIESKLDRNRIVRWGPRTIDLDLLWYHNEQVSTELLTLPHPRMWDRAFVVIPLNEIIGHETYPGLESIKLVLGKLEGKEGVRLWKKHIWPNE